MEYCLPSRQRDVSLCPVTQVTLLGFQGACFLFYSGVTRTLRWASRPQAAQHLPHRSAPWALRWASPLHGAPRFLKWRECSMGFEKGVSSHASHFCLQQPARVCLEVPLQRGSGLGCACPSARTCEVASMMGISSARLASLSTVECSVCLVRRMSTLHGAKKDHLYMPSIAPGTCPNLLQTALESLDVACLRDSVSKNNRDAPVPSSRLRPVRRCECHYRSRRSRSFL